MGLGGFENCHLIRYITPYISPYISIKQVHFVYIHMYMYRGGKILQQFFSSRDVPVITAKTGQGWKQVRRSSLPQSIRWKESQKPYICCIIVVYSRCKVVLHTTLHLLYYTHSRYTCTCKQSSGLFPSLPFSYNFYWSIPPWNEILHKLLSLTFCCLGILLIN